MRFDFSNVTLNDKVTAQRYMGSLHRPADLVIVADDGTPYLWRWHVLARNPSGAMGQVYLHIQTASDPERPLHDHPWDNMTLILAGSYDELVQCVPPYDTIVRWRRKTGQTIFRPQHWAHRLELPRDVPYAMTQFVTGAYKKDWGFWIGRKWYPHTECTIVHDDGRSEFKYPEGSQQEHRRLEWA